jgi:hypothetical protein
MAEKPMFRPLIHSFLFYQQSRKLIDIVGEPLVDDICKGDEIIIQKTDESGTYTILCIAVGLEGDNVMVLENNVSTPQVLDRSMIVFRYPSEKGPVKMEALHLNTVTIYINLHGSMNQKLLPDIPSNTVLGASVGCMISSNPTVTVVKQLRKLYTNKITDANRSYNFTTHKGADEDTLRGWIHRNKEEYEKEHSDKTIEEIEELYLHQLRSSSLRSYSYDRKYSIKEDDRVSRQGIFILHTSCIALQSAMNAMGVFVDPTLRELTTNSVDYLQRQNLLNVEVSTRLHPDGMTDDQPIPSNDLYSGILHYHNLKLSTILHFFGKFGIQHVNIVDVSCRVFRGVIVPEPMQRSISSDEKQKYSEIESTLKSIGKGGRIKKVNSMTRSYRKKSCKHQATYIGLHQWFKSEYEKLGWMVLAKSKGMHEKVRVYVHSVQRLHDHLECKIKDTMDKDRLDDLTIMFNDVKILLAHCKRDF